MDRSQRRWADATHNLERACELDPRNLPYLINLGSTYLWLHDYDQHIKNYGSHRCTSIQTAGQGGFFALRSKYTGERTQGLCVLQLKRS